MDILPGMRLGYLTSNTESAFLLLVVLPTIFWIVMLVDAIRREFREANMKLIWVLVLIFTHFIGALIYFFVGRSMGKIRQ